MNDRKPPVWNADKSVGERIAFTITQAQHIQKLLHKKRRWHDVALFSCGVDSMLRGCDLLRLKVSDVTNEWSEVVAFLNWRQKKLKNKPVSLAFTPITQASLKQWIEFSGKRRDDYLFTRCKPIHGEPIKTGRYREVVKEWATLIKLPPDLYSSHSLRRTKPCFLYEYGYSDIAHIADMLGHTDTACTLRYLGITKEEVKRHALEGDIFTADFNSLRKLTPMAREFLNPDFLDAFVAEMWVRLEPKLSIKFDEITKRSIQ